MRKVHVNFISVAKPRINFKTVKISRDESGGGRYSAHTARARRESYRLPLAFQVRKRGKQIIKNLMEQTACCFCSKGLVGEQFVYEWIES